MRKAIDFKGKSNKTLYRLSLIVFILKIYFIFTLPVLNGWKFSGHALLGADGESYLTGVDALLRDGFFSNSEILNYWPAGYPILLVIFGIFGSSNALTAVSMFQTLLYSFSVYIFCKKLNLTEIRKAVPIIATILLINPTLSMSTFCIGYESVIASGFLIIVSIYLSSANSPSQDRMKSLFFIMILLSVMGFLQPRILLASVPILVLFFYNGIEKKKKLIAVIVSAILLFSLPLLLIFRNYEAIGLKVISMNLGVTMNIGAGDNATGGYMTKWDGVPCNKSKNKVSVPPELKVSESDYSRYYIDKETTKCVIDWYLKNPVKGVKLFWKKSVFFWSPWYGVLANGTMARNPWLQFHPLKLMMKNEAGFKFVTGTFGIVFSWIWLFSTLLLLFYGFYLTQKLGRNLKYLSYFMLGIILSSWIVTLISIGDHRFRIPIMGMSLTFQALALSSFTKKSPFALIRKNSTISKLNK